MLRHDGFVIRTQGAGVFKILDARIMWNPGHEPQGEWEEKQARRIRGQKASASIILPCSPLCSNKDTMDYTNENLKPYSFCMKLFCSLFVLFFQVLYP